MSSFEASISRPTWRVAEEIVGCMFGVRRDAASVAEHQGPAVFGHEVRQVQGELPEVVGQAFFIEPEATRKTAYLTLRTT